MNKSAVILIFVIFSFSGYSQGVRMGLAGSPQLAWMHSDAGAVKSEGSIVGFNFGLMADFFFAERYSFSTGIFINNTGGKLNYRDSIEFETSDGTQYLSENTTIRYRIQYIDVPLALHLESNKIGYFVYNAQFGLVSQFRVGASADIDTEDISGVGCKDEVSFFNMGYNIGIGVDYYFSKNIAITLGLIYTNGFIDVTKDDNKDNVNDNVQLRSMALRIGIIF